jgi:phenylalanyl-tRNA synthetase beta chain
MRVPLEWLKAFIDTDLTAGELAHRLTMAGLEVEAVEEVGDDHVLEVNVTPNRADCLSILGIAREVSALTGKPVALPEYGVEDEAESAFCIEISDEELCQRYAGRVITGLSIADSPGWLRARLEKCGIRAINNVVDITNYVLLELGHPLHAFDLDTLGGAMIRVGAAGMGNRITTLDGVERELPAEALLIWDAERPVAIAGVMGGAETEVTGSTLNVFLESAWFKPDSIRRTSRRLGLRSESSYRFERGTDIEMLGTALDRAAFLMKKLAGGRVQKKVDVYPLRFAPRRMAVKYDKVNRLLGTDLSRQEMTDILRRLDLLVEPDADSFTVTPPPYRPDLVMDADIIEEVARLYGYEKIPTRVPYAELSPGRKPALTASVKEAVRKAGFDEAISYSFMNEKYLDVLNIPAGDRRRRAVRIKNPLRSEDSLLRTMLLPSLLEAFTHNFFRGIKDIRLFEEARVFEDTGEALPMECMHLGGVYFREKAPSLWKETAEDFYLVKGALEALLEGLKIAGCSFAASTEPFLHPGKSADISLRGEKIGYVGVLSPEVLEKLQTKTKPDVLAFELDMEGLMASVPESVTYEPIPRFPPVERDMAIVVDEGARASDLIALIRAYPSEFIEEVSVFDSFRGGSIPKGKKSLAFSIKYRSMKRTLTDEEVEAVHQGLLSHVTEKTGGEIRR